MLNQQKETISETQAGTVEDTPVLWDMWEHHALCCAKEQSAEIHRSSSLA